MKCPNCAGTVKVLSQTAMFCLDCDWDNLEERDFFPQNTPCRCGMVHENAIERIPAMERGRLSTCAAGLDRRVSLQQPSWKRLPNVLFPSFHRRGHEVTPQFQEQVSRWQKRQLLVSEDE